MSRKNSRHKNLVFEEANNPAANLDALQTPVLVHGREGLVLYCNFEAGELLGYEPERLKGKNFFNIGTDNPQVFEDRFRQIFEDGKIEYETVLLRGNDNFGLSLKIISSPVLWAGTEACICFITDISRYKKIENELDFERKQLLSIFDGIDEAVYISCPYTYEILYVNRFSEKIFGEKSVGRKCYEVFQGLKEPCNFCTNRIILNNEGEAYSWEHYNAEVDRYYWVIDRIIKWPDGRRVRFELAIDITARKRVEQALGRKLEIEGIASRASARFLENEDLFCSIQEAISEMGSFCGADRTHLFLLEDDGRKFSHLCEWCATGVESDSEVLSDLKVQDFRWLMAGLSTGNFVVVSQTESMPAEAEAERCHLEGRGIEAFMCIPLFVRGALHGFISFESLKKQGESCRDVEGIPLHTICRIIATAIEREIGETERKKLSEQLEVARRMESVGMLAGGIAHDFNNLLTVINNCAELAIKDLPADHSVQTDLVQIQRAGDRAASLTRQLLAFSRKQVMQPEPIILNDVITGLESMFRRLLGEDIDIEIHLDSNLGQVMADPAQMEQVLVNLAVNSREAMPEGGRLTIETLNVDLDEEYERQHVEAPAGPYVMMSITDTGCGMDLETQKRIFDPFYTTKGKSRGTGLGLSTVYGIVKQSEGCIWVYSEPGAGATFKIYLPRVSAECREKISKPKILDLSGDETILIVEDEDSVRLVAERILKNWGYRVFSTSCAIDAFRICEENEGEVDMLLTDVIMPKTSGKLLASRLERISPAIKVLYMSGYTDNSIVHHGVLDRGTHFIAKPFSASELLRKVREVLDQENPGKAH